jgi:hypothetical protein
MRNATVEGRRIKTVRQIRIERPGRPTAWHVEAIEIEGGGEIRFNVLEMENDYAIEAIYVPRRTHQPPNDEGAKS